MKIFLGIIGGACAVAFIVIVTLVSVLAATAVRPVHSIGVRTVLAIDSGHAPIAVTLYYPSAKRPRLVWLGSRVADLAPDAAIAGTARPLVIISHGTGGGPVSHIDTALALADAGYVVAAPLHNGDNFRDSSEVGTTDWIVDRARQISRVSDFLLTRWKDHDRIDAKRVGLFGFSAGGTTGLIAIGGVPDVGRVEPLCATHAEFVCTLFEPGARLRVPAASEWTATPAIRSAVIVAPGFGFTFEPHGLSAVVAPVQLWEGAADGSLPLATNAGAVRRLLPTAPDFHLVANADHFSFLTPCGMMVPLLPKMLCADPPGFDRTAFHKRFNASVVAFFDRTLHWPASHGDPGRDPM
jgi:predicted dienelactone hydrolase